MTTVRSSPEVPNLTTVPEPVEAGPGGDRPTHTHCPYCALQCAMTVTPAADPAAAVEVAPAWFPTNRGGLCRKGWTSGELLDHPGRLTTPLIRRDGRLEPCDWDTALDRVTEGIRRAQAAGGPDGVAVFGGGGLTNEKAYQLGKFTRLALGSRLIDYNGRWCMSSAAAAANRSFGLDRGLPFPVTDLTDARAVLLIGANPADTMPPFLQHLDTAARAGGLVVADPRLSATARRALDGGGVHLRLRPGTDAALALGLLHLVVVTGAVDTQYIAERTSGFDDAWAHAAAWLPDRTERVTGVSVAHLERAVALLADARDAGAGSYIVTARGAEQHADGTAVVGAAIALALALGLPGRPGSGYGTLTGQGNGQGGREHGQKADQLPGYRMITDPAARAHVAGVWGVDPEQIPGPGLSAFELLDSLGRPGGPTAMLLHASNPVVSAPDADRVTERLRALDTLVVADFVLSETAALADVVLPVPQWAEEEGTLTSLEGRVLRRRLSVTPPAGVRDELWIWHELARRLDRGPERFPPDARAVFGELARASAGGKADYSAIDWDRLDAGEALHWPCGADSPDGTPRLFLDRFATPDGRARFVVDEPRAPAEPPDSQFPLLGTTGRLLAHYQSGAQTRRVAELADAEPDMWVQVHPVVARAAGLVDGDPARIVSRRGAVEAVIRCDEDMRTDTVFLPFHFPGDGRANLLTLPELDPHSRMPEFKVCAVRLEAA
ncbi:molybdopterin oxidoreductase family protein [Dietzia kunjamensis]|uniref:molybdopterin oxidoreductase family protein n=1 Tax=Dietzia kunjamensis TaxID=322509 RepID=UPI002096BBB0|nr:molybdopterin oxidoreductase family protein [Dietzia kunjamensis]USX46600.1 molybdopterin oxidoreductase family protein [Dietzia kunjamensis]